MSSLIDTDLQVWVSCLACYNAGSPVGEWAPATDAADSRPCGIPGRDELEVMDYGDLDKLLPSGSSPVEVQRVAELVSDLDGEHLEAFAAWVADGSGDADEEGLERFEEAYQGAWGTFEDFARELADDIGLLHGLSDDLARYVDWSAWSRDLLLGGDYFTEDAANGRVFVFANY